MEMVHFLKAIADYKRLLILYLVRDKSLCVCDIQKVIPLTQGALSIQLKSLSVTGLLQSYKDGKWVFYELKKDIPRSYSNILQEVFQQMDQEKEVQAQMKHLKCYTKCRDSKIIKK